VLSLDASIPAAGDEWLDGQRDRYAYAVPLGLEPVDESAVDPAEAAIESTLSDDMNRIVFTLATRDAAIVFQRYGLDGEGPKTLDEVGKLDGVTRERIRQREAKALAALREPWSADVLREYANLRPATAST
jgi:DNA-directed RNA polymerase sigma subunit (sigma70/sigma32)